MKTLEPIDCACTVDAPRSPDRSASEATVPCRRRLGLIVLASGAASVLPGCGSLWPFGASKPKLPPPPPIAAPAGARQLWSVRLGPAGIGFLPAQIGDGVVAASSPGEVIRLGADGAQVWRVNVGKRLVTGVGADAETIVLAARDGSLIALDPDGKTRWSSPIGAEAVTVPAVGAGIVVIRASDNRVTAFDARTGRRRWSFQRQGVPLVLRQTAGVAVSADTVHVGLPGGRLVALNAQTGALRWEAAVSQPKGATEIERIADIAGTPAIVGREVCAVSFQGRLACADAATGRVVWNREISSSGGISADERMIVSADDRGRIHAFSRGGSSLWRQEGLAGRALSAPLLLGGLVFVGDQQGALHLLSVTDGAVAGRFDLDSAIDSAPVATGTVAVVQTRAGTLHAVTTR